MKLNKLAGVIGFTAATLFSVSALAAGVDKDLPDYTPTSGISGNLSSVGSDTLANMMTLWAEEFKRLYPTSTCNPGRRFFYRPDCPDRRCCPVRSDEPCHEGR